MSSTDSDSDNQPPPDAAGEPVAGSSLRSHPVWAAAKGQMPRVEAAGGRGRGRGRGRGLSGSDAGDDAPPRPRFAPISLSALEQEGREAGDGADSRLDSEDDRAADDFGRVRPRASPKEKKQKAPAQSGDGGSDDSDDSDDEDDEEDRPTKKSRLEGLLGAAAFGGGAQRPVDASEQSECSETPSARREADLKQAFPLRGVSCVGCSLPGRIGPVVRFVNEHISSMTPDALFKAAALVFRTKVQEVSEREGVVCPAWPWKEVRSHFCLHVSATNIQRHNMLRSLQAMRSQLELGLVRVEGDGDRAIDKVNAELMLKTVAAESRERVLLDQATNRRAGGRGGGSSKDD